MKNIVKFFSVFTIGMALLVFLFPFFLSTPFGKNSLLHLINQQSSVKISIEEVKLRWNKSLEIGEIKVSNHSKKPIFQVQKIRTKDSLWAFIRNGFKFEEIWIEEPDLFISSTPPSKSSGALIPFYLADTIHVKEGSLALQQQGQPGAFLKGIEADLSLPRNLNRFKIHFTSTTEYQNKKGMIDLHSFGFFDREDFWGSFQGEFLGKAVTFPSIFLESLLRSQGFVFSTKALGGHLHFDTKITKSPDTFTLDLYALSDRLQADIRTKDTIIQGSWSLNLKGIELPPKFSVSGIDFSDLSGKIQKLKIPLKNHKLSLRNAEFDIALGADFNIQSSLQCHLDRLSIKSSDVSQFLDFSWSAAILIDQSKGSLEGGGQIQKPFEFDLSQVQAQSLLQVPLSGRIQKCAFNLDGPVSAAKFQAKAHMNLDQTPFSDEADFVFESTFSIPTLQMEQGVLSVNSPQFQAKLPLSFSLSPLAITLREKTPYEYFITPSLVKYFLPGFTDYLSLEQPLVVEGVIEPFKIFYKTNWYTSSPLSTKFQIVKGELIELQTKDLISLAGTRGSIEINQNFEEIETGLATSFSYKNFPASVKLAGSIRQFPLLKKASRDKASGRFEADIKEFPTVFVSSFFPKKGVVENWAGPTFSGQITWIHSANKELSIDLKSGDFSIVGSFDFDKGMEAKRPLEIQSTITAEKSRNIAATWNLDPRVLIDEPFKISLQVERISIPSWNYWEFDLPDWDQALFKGNLSVSTLSLPYFVSQNQTLILPSRLDFSKKTGQDCFIDFTSAAQLNNDKAGTLKLQSSFSPQSAYPYIKTDKNASFQATGENMPAAFLDTMADLTTSISFPLFSSLGDSSSFRMQLNTEKGTGPLSFHFKSKYSRLDIQGLVVKSTLLLKEDATASILWNPKLEKTLADPSYQIEFANPIELKVPAKSTMIKLDKNILSQSVIPLIKLSLGKCSVSNKGLLQNVSSLFRLKNQRLHFWFAPFEAKCSQGILQVARTEVLVENSFEVCLWGNINILKSYVNFHLGLTEQGLKRALGIHGLDPSFVLDVPIKGPYKKVSVDTKLAAAKIGALIAHSQSDHFGDFKPFVDLFHAMMNDQSSIPPPRPPYPWNNPIASMKLTPERTLKKRKKDKELFDYPLPLRAFSFEQATK